MLKKKDFRDLFTLSKRNTKLFFKEKSAFFSSLITPMILLVLFIAFLKSVYTASLVASLPEGVVLEKSVLDSFAGTWLMSSVLGVTCITVAFCVNMIMVNDKVNKATHDMLSTPVKKSTISLSYFISNVLSTLIVNYACMLLGFIYILFVGWYFAFADVLMIILSVFLCSLFGCSLACVIEYFISSSGGLSAIATLVSSMYGFISGAYMPLSQFSAGVRNVISCLPGTYGIGLLREYYMRGVLNEMSKTLPPQSVTSIKDAFDGNMYFFGDKVPLWVMFAIVAITTLILIGIFLCFVYVKKRNHSAKKLKQLN